MTEAEVRVTWGCAAGKAGGFWKLAKAKKWILPQKLRREHSSADLFQTLTSRTVRE